MRTLLCVLFCLLSLSLSANYVQNKPIEQTQPDGTVLNLFVTGDEYYHRVHDADGYTILLNQKGFAVYAIPDGKSIKASEFFVGKADPTALGITPNLKKYIAPSESRRPNNIPVTPEGSRYSAHGTINNIVIFVRFLDQSEFPTSKSYSWYNDLFNSWDQQSIKDYYDEVSSGQLTVNSHLYRSSGNNVLSFMAVDVKGWYQPWSETNIIGYPNDVIKTTRLAALVSEMCTIADPFIPEDIDIDMDNDGVNDGLTFIIRGAPDSWGDLLWPTHYPWGVPVGVINGVAITHFILDFESGIDASVICHEMGHNVGFPDLYRYTTTNIEPVADWSLMATDNAQHETAYEKWHYGTWFSTIPTITPSSTPTQYTLTAIDQNPYACYKIASIYDNQFYMVEYRRKTGRYESGVPGSGLIVYRITDTWSGADVRGNSDGPPDEVYVYRPGGDVDTNGSTSLACLTSSLTHNSIYTGGDPEPWLYLSSTTQANGNLSIIDVGATGGTTITFTVLGGPPNVWNGTTNNNWSIPTNWSLNVIPASDHYVIIPYVVGRAPALIEPGYCSHLVIKPGATFHLSIGPLYDNGGVDNYGTLNMQYDGAAIVVTKDLVFHTGCSANITANVSISIQGNLEFQDGTSISMTNGTLRFYGNGDSFIRINDSAAIYNFESDKNDTYVTFFTGLPTHDFTVRGSIKVFNGSAAYNSYSGNMMLYGDLIVYSGGLCQFDTGTLTFGGASSGDANLSFGTLASYLNKVTIHKPSGHTVFFTNATQVRNTLTISGGSLNAGANTIYVWGDWVNMLGPTHFIQGTSTVIFNGYSNQFITYSEDFNNIELNKTVGILYINSPVVVTCTSYNWTAGSLLVSGGTFTASDIADDGIYGNITLNTGYIYFHQDTSSYIDLRGSLSINGGEMHIYGGGGDMLWPYVNNASLTMSSGVLDIHDVLVYVYNSGTLTTNITGGTIRVGKGFWCNRADFIPTGNTLEMYSSTDANLNMAAGSLYNVIINKAARGPEEEITGNRRLEVYGREGNQRVETRANGVTLLHGISCHNLTLNAGVLNSSGYNISCNGNLIINNSTLNFGSGGTLSMYFSKNLIVNSGGILNVYGTSSVPATVTSSSGTYDFWVESGATIKADYTIFEKMAGYGLEVHAGATVDPAHAFTGCTFRNGGAYGVLLLLDSDQNLLISNAVFPTNTWSGYYNVRKTVNKGMVNFANATGAYSGESYDDDIYSRIVWTAPTSAYDLQILRAEYSRPSSPVGETVTLKVTLLNMSTTNCTVGSNYLDYYHSRTTAPTANLAGNQWLTISSLAAGMPTDFTFTVTNPLPSGAGTWNSWLQIDTDQHVTESNETNNVYGPFQFVWVYLPPVTNITITRSGLSQVFLHWDYSTPCDWYGVYRSSNPIFTPSPSNNIAWVTYPAHTYYDNISSKYFYIITAALDDDPQEKNFHIVEIQSPETRD